MVKRRRFLSIVAACTATPLARAAAAAEPVVWRGTAMGALASMTLLHPDREWARSLMQRCVAEIDRLESVFSLYRTDSALSRLNAAGQLRDPPFELVELLSHSLALARASGGAFDPTVQPLYRLYAAHFGQAGATPAGPPAAAIARARRHVGYAGVEIDADRVRLQRPGMAVTLNGIAQGYVTDRVADQLRAAGLTHLMIDLGELRAHGAGRAGAPWRAAVGDPRSPSHPLLELRLGDAAGALPALATSAGAGTVFGADPRINHLFDPATGHSANRWLSVSVAAPRATAADGLSTALSVLPIERAARLLGSCAPARAWLAHPDGRLVALDSGKQASERRKGALPSAIA
ncbi:MAG TPA: FAD:protein FMN transferase [Rubrivivax sp.]|nr:FAD:protein FMN transferase [Rubrivivax sp.]